MQKEVKDFIKMIEDDCNSEFDYAVTTKGKSKEGFMRGVIAAYTQIIESHEYVAMKTSLEKSKERVRGYSMDVDNDCWRCKNSTNIGILTHGDNWCVSCGRIVGKKAEEKKEPQKQTLWEFMLQFGNMNGNSPEENIEMISDYLETQYRKID